MFVSRCDETLQKALDSVSNQEFDDFRVYVDMNKIVDFDELKKILLDTNVIMNRACIREQVSVTENKHTNLVHNLHRALWDTETEWVTRLDDDDWFTDVDRKSLVDEFGKEDVGVIYGDKIVKTQYQDSYVDKTEQINSYRELENKRIFTGSSIIRTEAFKQVHPIVDHGWFCDWKIFYWIMRAGYKVKYVPQVLFHQNWKPPSSIRGQQYGRFPEFMEYADSIPDELLESCKDFGSWKEHLSFVE